MANVIRYEYTDLRKFAHAPAASKVLLYLNISISLGLFP